MIVSYSVREILTHIYTYIYNIKRERQWNVCKCEYASNKYMAYD